MKEARAVKFSQSTIFKSLLLLILATVLIASISIFFFVRGQVKSLIGWSSDNNRTQLRQMVIAANTDIRLFANRIIFLTHTTEIQSLDSSIAGAYINSDNIASLFNDDETINLYDDENNLICERQNDFADEKVQLHFDISRIPKHNSYFSPWSILQISLSSVLKNTLPTARWARTGLLSPSPKKARFCTCPVSRKPAASG